MKAMWNDALLAESENTIVVEGNQYFPHDTIKKEFFRQSGTKTTCSWKGIASYYSVIVNGKTNNDCAWYYPEPSDAAKQIKNYVAFWNGVKIVK